MSLAEKLVTLRKRKGLTQMDLAERLNVSRQAISRWEVGAAVPGTDNLKILGDLYGVSVDYLLNDELSEDSKSAQKVEDSTIITECIPKRAIYKPLMIGFVAIVIVTTVMICVLGSRNENPNQIAPMNDMYVETEGEHSDGTFVIK